MAYFSLCRVLRIAVTPLALMFTSTAALASTLTKQLDATANIVMQKHAVPGLAIVLVKDGKVEFEKGFGLTKISRGTAVSATTLFKVGSISKSMTALALALLVQDEKLKWDDPLLSHIPELRAAYPAVAQLTIRQILSHQTGIDLDRLEPLLWPQPNQFEFENIVAGLKVLAEKPVNTGIFKYSNVNYALAGEVVHRASGMRYGEYVQRKIFAPLKMHCVINHTDTGLRKSIAQPHQRIYGVTHIVRADLIEGVISEGLDAAAGGVRCDVNALGKWLQFQLKPRASALRLSDALWRDLHSAQAAVRTDFDAALKPTAIETYGLGLQITAADGEIRYDHYGGVAGSLAYFAASPSHNSGFAVLMNMSAGLARKELIEQLSLLMRGKPLPTYKRIFNRAVPTPASLSTPNVENFDRKIIAPYFGRYQDAWFGEVSICPNADGAMFISQRSPRFKGKLVLIEQDRVALLWEDKAVNSDAVITIGEQIEATVQRFTFTPRGESDFDFGAMRFQRIGDCF